MTNRAWFWYPTAMRTFRFRHDMGFPVRATLAGLLLLASVGGRAGSLAFRSPETLPALSMTLPLMADAKAVPLPPLQTFRYTLTRGAETWQEDRFDPYALWYAEQHAAEWIDARGCRVVLGIVHSVLPTGFEGQHVTRGHYAEAAASAAASIEQVDLTLLRRWAQDFGGIPLGEPRSLAINRSRLAELWDFPTGNPQVNAFLFRFDRRRGGQAHLPDLWLALFVTTPGLDLPREQEAVRRDLLGGIAATSRFEDRSPSTRFGTRDAEVAVRPHPTRDAARRSIAHLADWWYRDSEDYIVLSNHRDAQRFAQDLLEDLQSARALYARSVPAFAPTSEDVSIVRLFASDREYDTYVGPDHAWSSGLFDASRRELILRAPASRGRDAQYAQLLRIALHEGFHQYLFNATGGLPTSSWFNEGHATFFEATELDRRGATIGENEGRIKDLQALVGSEDFSLRPLLGMDYAAFYGGSEARRLGHYSLAWGLVYYLQRGAPLERNRPHAAVLTRYLEALSQGADPGLATATAFDGISLEAFERSFAEFWKSSRLRNSARRAGL